MKQLLFIITLVFVQSSHAQWEMDLIKQDLNWDSSPVAVLQSNAVSLTPEREIHFVTLTHPVAGNIKLYVSAPKGFQKNPALPVLFISAGFFTGAASVGLVPHNDKLILVGYQYPTTLGQIEKDPSLLLKSIRITPAQIALSLQWLRAQSWVHPQKLSVMGISLGSLFLPVSLHLAQEKSVFVNGTILAFGGSDASDAIMTVLRNEFPQYQLDPMAQWGLRSLLALHDPTVHLPALRAPFLVIGATEDSIFRRSNTEAQFALLQGYKEIHWAKGPHIDVDRPDVIRQTMEILTRFLTNLKLLENP